MVSEAITCGRISYPGAMFWGRVFQFQNRRWFHPEAGISQPWPILKLEPLPLPGKDDDSFGLHSRFGMNILPHPVSPKSDF